MGYFSQVDDDFQKTVKVICKYPNGLWKVKGPSFRKLFRLLVFRKAAEGPVPFTDASRRKYGPELHTIVGPLSGPYTSSGPHPSSIHTF